MSASITEGNDIDNLDVPQLPCPACIESATGEDELVPAYALKTYTLDQLIAHLESDVHDQRELMLVCLRASIYLYRLAFAHAFKELERLR